MNKPVVSSKFDLDNIRKIRDYNSFRHSSMTRSEIVADTREGAASLLQALLNTPNRKPITILSGDHRTARVLP